MKTSPNKNRILLSLVYNGILWDRAMKQRVRLTISAMSIHNQEKRSGDLKK